MVFLPLTMEVPEHQAALPLSYIRHPTGFSLHQQQKTQKNKQPLTAGILFKTARPLNIFV